MRFYKKIRELLEAAGDLPPPPPALIQSVTDTKLSMDEIFNFIKKHEGYKKAMYLDTQGIPTIGIGFNLTRPDAALIASQAGANVQKLLTSQEQLSDSQIKQIFQITLKIAYNDAKKWIPAFDTLPKNIKMAILDMSFNLGYTRLSKFIKTRQFIMNSDFKGAAQELRNSKWASQVGNRAENVIKLFSS